MRMGPDSGITGNRARGVVCPHGKTGMRMRPGAKPAKFIPEIEDLKTVQGYLEREIKRLQRRHKAVTRALRSG